MGRLHTMTVIDSKPLVFCKGDQVEARRRGESWHTATVLDVHKRAGGEQDGAYLIQWCGQDAGDCVKSGDELRFLAEQEAPEPFEELLRRAVDEVTLRWESALAGEREARSAAIVVVEAKLEGLRRLLVAEAPPVREESLPVGAVEVRTRHSASKALAETAEGCGLGSGSPTRGMDPLTEESLVRLRGLLQEIPSELCSGQQAPSCDAAPLAELEALSMRTTALTSPEPSSYNDELDSLVEAVRADVQNLTQDRMHLMRERHAACMKKLAGPENGMLSGLEAVRTDVQQLAEDIIYEHTSRCEAVSWMERRINADVERLRADIQRLEQDIGNERSNQCNARTVTRSEIDALRRDVRRLKDRRMAPPKELKIEMAPPGNPESPRTDVRGVALRTCELWRDRGHAIDS